MCGGGNAKVCEIGGVAETRIAGLMHNADNTR